MTDTRVARRDEETWWGVSLRGAALSAGALCLAVVLVSRRALAGAAGLAVVGVGFALPLGDGDVVDLVSRTLARWRRRRWVGPLSEGRLARIVPVVGHPVLNGEDPLDLPRTLERVARRGGGTLQIHLEAMGGTRRLLVIGEPTSGGEAPVWGSLYHGPWREYRSHLRSLDGVLQVGRVSRGVEGYWPLASLVEAGGGVRVVLLARVAGEGEGRRRSSRRAHRAEADGESLRERGFRLSARRRESRDRVHVREEEIARGRAWVEWGLYVLLDASTLEELRQRRELLDRRLHSAGLTLTVGRGRQGEFVRAVRAMEGGVG